MAAGSEKFAWKLYPGVPHVCASCGRDLRVEDVGRIHHAVTYRDGVGYTSTAFYCTDCRHAGYERIEVA